MNVEFLRNTFEDQVKRRYSWTSILRHLVTDRYVGAVFVPGTSGSERSEIEHLWQLYQQGAKDAYMACGTRESAELKAKVLSLETALSKACMILVQGGTITLKPMEL